jgi:hypothetical protein
MNVFIAHYVLENFLLFCDIEDHVKTAKHRSAINATASANIRDFFKAKDGNKYC